MMVLLFECAKFSGCLDNDGDYECICEDGFEQTETLSCLQRL